SSRDQPEEIERLLRLEGEGARHPGLGDAPVHVRVILLAYELEPTGLQLLQVPPHGLRLRIEPPRELRLAPRPPLAERGDDPEQRLRRAPLPHASNIPNAARRCTRAQPRKAAAARSADALVIFD